MSGMPTEKECSRRVHQLKDEIFTFLDYMGIEDEEVKKRCCLATLDAIFSILDRESPVVDGILYD